jgi:hypothetical protein
MNVVTSRVADLRGDRPIGAYLILIFIPHLTSIAHWIALIAHAVLWLVNDSKNVGDLSLSFGDHTFPLCARLSSPNKRL